MEAPKRPAHTPRHRRPASGRKRRVGKPILIVIGALAMVVAGVGIAFAG
ncbi:hypothetical protein [Phytohabitans aurantiacus]|jgi:hypothetical protein|uniref:Uncharacterized protein n=1 Tax=Phytohabitans aurantiacus TaxID=3016789 RepID=A0ABQ5R8S6_9ACTN|nr:hypothetical protein [Phytohabitans aurantiacus]GLI02542.1 hypothetical protein Pa4123_78200 [Phytohabitans aurantiacus]